jgi:RNA polymerase sigma-70 factor, ECF subfamily
MAQGWSDMDDDRALLHRIKEGSAEAFAALVRLHHARVRAYLGCNLTDKSVVDDLAQEVFFSAYRTLNTYKGDVPLGTWLVGIARNRLMTYLRTEARRQHRNSTLQSAIAEWRTAEVGARPPESADEDKRISALALCLKKLPGVSAELIRDYYFNGRSSEELSQRLGKQAGVLRMTIRRIRQALRRCVEESMAVEKA